MQNGMKIKNTYKKYTNMLFYISYLIILIRVYI